MRFLRERRRQVALIMMKTQSLRRIASVLLLGALLQFCFAAAANAKPLRVLASFYPMYVMALNVVGDTPGVRVECMTEPITGCLHDYQLTPANLQTLASSDVFIVNGAGMENFLAKAAGQAPHLKVIQASEGVKLLHGNPHVWVSPGGAIAETAAIARGLAAADPAHAAAYEKNAAAYTARLEALRQKMHAALDGLQHRDIITFHEAFPYFASEFHLNIVGVVEREPGSEPSAGELAQTITLVRQSKVKALFAEPQYPAKSAQVIERETGVPVRILDPAVTGPKDPAQARDTYLKTMEANLTVLQKALQD
jgi:zinc transport system substrate-binding protein